MPGEKVTKEKKEELINGLAQKIGGEHAVDTATRIVRIGINYRSTGSGVKFAEAILSNNAEVASQTLDKILRSETTDLHNKQRKARDQGKLLETETLEQKMRDLIKGIG